MYVRACAHASAHMWRSKDKLQGLVLSCHHMNSKFRFLDLARSTFTQWATSLTQNPLMMLTEVRRLADCRPHLFLFGILDYVSGEWTLKSSSKYPAVSAAWQRMPCEQILQAPAPWLPDHDGLWPGTARAGLFSLTLLLTECFLTAMGQETKTTGQRVTVWEGVSEELGTLRWGPQQTVLWTLKQAHLSSPITQHRMLTDRQTPGATWPAALA